MIKVPKLSIPLVATIALAMSCALSLAQDAKPKPDAARLNASNRNVSNMNATLPLFYQSLTAFDWTQHGKLGFPEVPPDFLYAAKTNVIPILINEIGQALRHYPLVFIPGADGQSPTLVALVGTGDEVNHFVNAKGEWRKDTYIPAWVRRYPFFAARSRDGKDVLAFDDKAGWIMQSGGQSLVGPDGQPTQRLKHIVEFQQNFQLLAERTASVSRALLDAGLLEQGNLRVQPPGSQNQNEAKTVQGFLLVSEKKLRELDGAALHKLQQADALPLAYAQLLSLGSLGNLAR
jgi:SapC